MPGGSQKYLRFFSKTYGAYPFTELDVVEATLVGGAGVEFSGMVLMAGFSTETREASIPWGS